MLVRAPASVKKIGTPKRSVLRNQPFFCRKSVAKSISRTKVAKKLRFSLMFSFTISQSRCQRVSCDTLLRRPNGVVDMMGRLAELRPGCWVCIVYNEAI